MTRTIMELSDRPCSACGCGPAWVFPTGIFCASCYHDGALADPKIVASVNRSRQRPEADFGRQVDDLFRLFGWTFYHTWNSIHSPAGFPDRVAVRLSRLLFIELKSAKGKISPAQWVWIAALEATGKCEVHVWKEGQISLEEIQEILR